MIMFLVRCYRNSEFLKITTMNCVRCSLRRGLQSRYIRTRAKVPRSRKDLRSAQEIGERRRPKLDIELRNVDEAKIREMGHILNSENEFRGCRSRFTKAKTKSKPELVTKPPAQIERELKALFRKDGVEYDSAFVQDIIKRSKTEKKILEDSLRGGQKLQRVNDESIKNFVSWMIEDCRRRIFKPINGESDERRNAEAAKITETVADKRQYQELTDSIGIDLFEMCLRTEELSQGLAPSGLEALPGFLDVLSRSDSADSRKLVTLEQLMQIFVISGQIGDDRLRNKCLYLTGNLISMQTSGRADPINERMYILALTYYKEFDKAIYLFNSRRNKNDVKLQRFWLEMGAEIYLRMPMDHTKEAEQIAAEIFAKFHYIHPVLQLIFIEKYLALSNWQKAFGWWENLKKLMNDYGLCQHLSVPNSQIVNDSRVAYNYYNRIEPLTYDNTLDAFMCFMKYERFDEMMSIIRTVTLRDKRFLLFLVDQLQTKMSYPGREYLCQCFEEDLKMVNPKYETVIEEYILTILNQKRPTILTSKKEAEFLDEICSYLSTQLTDSEMSSRDRLKTSSLISSLAIGSKITSFAAKNLMKVLFLGHNRKGFDLASRVLDYMNMKLVNVRTGNKTKSGIFPPANAHIYLTLVQLFGRRDKPRIREIEKLISMMEEYQIPILTVFANQVLLTYAKAKQFTKAIEFLDNFLSGDDPNSFPQPTSQFASTAMHLYRSKEATEHGKGLLMTERNRLAKVRNLFRMLIQTPGCTMNEELLTESVLTFMTFGDYASAVCALEYNGFMEENKRSDGIIPNQMIVSIKAKLNASIVKMERQLSEDQAKQLQHIIQSFREKCGLMSLDSQLMPDKVYNWRDAAATIIKFEMVFDFNPRLQSLRNQFCSSTIPGGAERNKGRFEEDLLNLQKFYDLPAIGIDEII
ncbi:DEBR0S5_04720g1_1 [Brettanomyces bruxellensis]|uniref:DEBR0S5_04720g1_1 n=1 Tax=Dekkera bruxellensis TaxID=5007 RepID=A0A7D9CZQ9_DEKBR|nr:DEBR0S5_04720g1_1 [Brettanomyces bruxellensis]